MEQKQPSKFGIPQLIGRIKTPIARIIFVNVLLFTILKIANISIDWISSQNSFLVWMGFSSLVIIIYAIVTITMTMIKVWSKPNGDN